MAKRFGKKVYAIEYQHADDGTLFRHDFTDPNDDLIAEDDGSLRVKSRAGRPLWGEYTDRNHTRVMMQNPRGRKRKTAKRTRKAGHAARRATPRRKATRVSSGGVPGWVRAKGFSSWAAYMASIRPGGGTVKRRRRKAHRGASASHHTRRRRRAPVAAAPRRRRRRHFASNPFGASVRSIGGGYSPKVLMHSAIEGVKDAAAGVGGMAVARLARGRLNIDGNTPKGAIVELGIGLLTAPLISKFAGPSWARAYVQGAFMGPAITAIKSAHVPVIAPALGDEGELPLFGGMYDLAGTYDLDQLHQGNGPAQLPAGRVGDELQLAGVGGDEGYM